jgi:hypothetical protein
MSRWIVRRTIAVNAWVKRSEDHGQTSFEYLGIAVVIAVIIGVLASTTSIGDTILTGILSQITKITGH